MANLDGFWSYVHDDDNADHGRISQLARDVAQQFEMITGEKISLFLDRDEIDWGDNWKNKIDNSLTTVGYFVPILTPRYFQHAECRRELQAFAHIATDLGIKDLIMPLLYVDVPAIHEQTPTDELIQLVKTFQWKDWKDLRFAAVDSESYRRGVAELAARLAEANKHAEEVSKITLPQQSHGENSEEEPGFVDLLADFEEKLNQTPQTLTEITEEIQKIGQIMNTGIAEMTNGQTQKSTFANRLIITRRVVHQLQEPVERIWILSNELSSQLHSIDRGYRILIEQMPIELEKDPNTRESVCNFFGSIRFFATSANEGSEGVQAMIDATEPLDRMSREYRPVTRRLRQGLMLMMELKGLSQEWLNLMDASGVECVDK